MLTVIVIMRNVLKIVEKSVKEDILIVIDQYLPEVLLDHFFRNTHLMVSESVLVILGSIENIPEIGVSRELFFSVPKLYHNLI